MVESFSDFMSKNYKKFVAYCVSRGQTLSNSDEIVNEAFFRIWRIWDQRAVKGEELNKKWMYNAIEYIIKEYLRHDEKHITEDITEHVDTLSQDDSPDCGIRYAEFLDRILMQLNENDRELFKLAYIEERSYNEISAILKINNQTLRTRISRLKNKINKIIFK